MKNEIDSREDSSFADTLKTEDGVRPTVSALIDEAQELMGQCDHELLLGFKNTFKTLIEHLQSSKKPTLNSKWARRLRLHVKLTSDVIKCIQDSQLAIEE